MERRKIELLQKGDSNTVKELYIDGKKVSGVTSFAVNCEPNKVPTVTIGLLFSECVIDSELMLVDKNTNSTIKDIIFDDGEQ